MERDIVPELLQAIKQEFSEQIGNSRIVTNSAIALDKSRATYADANRLAIEAGNILSEILLKHITGDVLPDGRMYFNIAKRIMEDVLSENHELVASYCEQVQTLLNQQAGFRIRGIKPELNQSRIDGVVNRLLEAEQFEDVKWLLDEPVKNFTQSVVDDSAKANADFHYKAGLKPQIIRKSTGHCCDWCDAVVGTYDYPEVPKDVFRRHRYCRCTVEYVPGRKGKRINVHTKKEFGSKEDRERRIAQYEKMRAEDAERRASRNALT